MLIECAAASHTVLDGGFVTCSCWTDLSWTGRRGSGPDNHASSDANWKTEHLAPGWHIIHIRGGDCAEPVHPVAHIHHMLTAKLLNFSRSTLFFDFIYRTCKSRLVLSTSGDTACSSCLPLCDSIMNTASCRGHYIGNIWGGVSLQMNMSQLHCNSLSAWRLHATHTTHRQFSEPTEPHC